MNDRSFTIHLVIPYESVKPVTDTEIKIHPRKLEIVQAAVTCFLDNGYHQTGVRDIARQAGISLGNLYNHFKGKDAVLAFIAEIEGAELDGFIQALTEATAPRAALEQFIDGYADYVSQPENAILGVEILTEALRNEPIAEAFDKTRDRLTWALAQCLTAGTKQGIFAPYDNPHTIACMILDTLEGEGLRSLSNSRPHNTHRRTLKQFILAGLRA